MEHQRWVHPYDETGRKRDFGEIPHHLKFLRDDPYRSLAAYVRNAGGYRKVPAPFAEFAWADYFRKRIEPAALAKHRFEAAVEQGIVLARDAAAAQLPGYINAPRWLRVTRERHSGGRSPTHELKSKLLPSPGYLDKMLREEPHLQFPSADHIRDDQVIGAIVALLGGLRRCVVGVSEDHLVRLQQAGEHCRHLLAPVWRASDPGDLRGVPGIANRDAAQRLHPLGDFVDQRELLAGMLIEQEVKLVEGRSAHQPMMLLVQRVKDLRVGEDLIQPLTGIRPRVM
jgi:Putative ParB-like nuclease